jgi:hypothetical protein
MRRNEEQDITRFDPENDPLSKSSVNGQGDNGSTYKEHQEGEEEEEGKSTKHSWSQAEEKVQSLVQQKEERLARKRLLKQARLEQSLLPSFVRLGDCIMVEHLISAFFNNLYGFDKLLEAKQASKKTGLFETTVHFDGSITIFSPTCDQIQSTVQQTIENLVDRFDGVNRMLYIITQLTSRTVTGPSISGIIRASPHFERIVKFINRKIDADFDKVYQHAQTFDSVRPVYDFNRSWDLEAFKRKDQSVLEFKNMIDQLLEWARELEKLRNRPVGVLEVDSRKLKHDLIDIRNEREEEITSFLKEKARNECSSLLGRYEQMLLQVNQDQEEVNRETLEDSEKLLFKETAQVDQLYALMRQYEISVPSQDTVVHSMLTEKHQEYKKLRHASNTQEGEMVEGEQES